VPRALVTWTAECPLLIVAARPSGCIRSFAFAPGFQKQREPEQLWADDEFWTRTASIFDWRWREEDHKHAPLVRDADATELGLGLPQGLVASGFFANAYLVGFNRAIHQAAKDGVMLEGGVKVLDYSRYVDDIRIVVEAPFEARRVGQFAEAELVKHCRRLGAKHQLKLSDDKRKSTVTPYRSISAQSNMSALIDVLNAQWEPRVATACPSTAPDNPQRGTR
jgi:hypothetical protein